jgi:hypothetical protein
VVGDVAEVLNQSNENSDSTKQGIQHIKVKTGRFLKEKWDSKEMHGWYIKSMDKQLISKEDIFLWLSREYPKVGAESKIMAVQDQTLKPNIMRQKYYEQKQIANADTLNNFQRQCNTSYQHAHCWQKNGT